jgi:hypothetical protein
MSPNWLFFYIAMAMVLQAQILSAQPPLPNERTQEAQRRLRRTRYEFEERRAQSMPKLDVTRLKDVFELHLDKAGALSITPPVVDPQKLGVQQYQVALKDLPGTTYLRFFPLGVRARPLQPIGGNPQAAFDLSLSHTHLGPQESLSTITLQSRPGLLTLTLNELTDAGQLHIRLTQQSPDFAGAKPSIQLNVTRLQANGALVPNLVEPDFGTLLKKHAIEVNLYLRPLLCAIHQEDILTPDRAIVLQVLADHFPANDAAEKRVAELVPGLADPDFRHRERAARALIELGGPGVAVLRKLERSRISPEQNRLIDVALEPYSQLPQQEVDRLKADRNFLLQCLSCEDAAIRGAAFEQLCRVADRQDLKFDAAASAADRMDAIQALRKELINSN